MTGCAAAPFDSFLITRGLKTLDIRMDRHCANAMKVAKFLEGHPAVRHVCYPGLEHHPQHALAARMYEHGGSAAWCRSSWTATARARRSSWTTFSCARWPSAWATPLR